MPMKPKKKTGRPAKRATDGSGRSRFGARLIRARGERSVDDVAIAAELSEATVYQLECGRQTSRPREATVRRLDAAVGADGELLKFFFRCLPDWEGADRE